MRPHEYKVTIVFASALITIVASARNENLFAKIYTKACRLARWKDGRASPNLFSHVTIETIDIFCWRHRERDDCRMLRRDAVHSALRRLQLFQMSVTSSSSTTLEVAYRMPAEWEPHSACLLLYPHNGGTFRLDCRPAQEQVLQVARAISHHGKEDVVLFCINDTSMSRITIQTIRTKTTRHYPWQCVPVTIPGRAIPVPRL